MAFGLPAIPLLLYVTFAVYYTSAIPPYRNDFEGFSVYASPGHTAISGIFARFRGNAFYSDRVYTFTSQTVSPASLWLMMRLNYVRLTGKFQLSGTPYRQYFLRNCYKNGKWGVLTDVVSSYDGLWHDRTFSFSCRWLDNFDRNFKVSGCSWTPYTTYRGYIIHIVPYNRVIVRVRSRYSVTYKDRRFSFRQCRVIVD